MASDTDINSGDESFTDFNLTKELLSPGEKFGDRTDPGNGNFKGGYPHEYAESLSSDDIYGSREVGQYESNARGLFDMHGNVSEWFYDRFNSRYPGGLKTDYAGPESGTDRVLRGKISRTIVGLSVAIRIRSARRSGFASSLPRALKWVSRNYKKRNNQELFLCPVSFGKTFSHIN